MYLIENESNSEDDGDTKEDDEKEDVTQEMVDDDNENLEDADDDDLTEDNEDENQEFVDDIEDTVTSGMIYRFVILDSIDF